MKHVDKDNKLRQPTSVELMLKSYQDTSGPAAFDYSSEVQQYSAKSNLGSTRYFYELFSKGKPAKAKLPLVGYFCNLVPEEIILALGAIPVRLCSADYLCAKVGEEMLPGDICPVIKSICGAADKQNFAQFDLLVVPAACDGKMKLSELLPAFKEVYFLDLPRDSDYLNNAKIWAQKYFQFYEFLSQRFKCKVGRKELLGACEITNQRTAIFRKIYDFRLRHPGIIDAYDYFILAYTAFFTNPLPWIKQAKKLYAEASDLANKSGFAFSGRKILLSGSPVIFPDFKILKILKETGCDISADTLCSAYGHLHNPVEIDEQTQAGIIRALGLKYIAATICPCFLGIEKLSNAIIDTVKENSLDGVIYHNLRLCQVFEIQGTLIKQILKQHKIPYLSIKTDLGKEDVGQLKTRIEAFLEMLG